MVTDDLVKNKPDEALKAAPAPEGEEEKTRADEKKAKRIKRRRTMRVLDRIAGFIIATVIVAGCACLGLEYILVKGPSESLRDMFVGTMSETRRFRFIPRIFLTEDEMSAITDRSDSNETIKTDQSLISLPADSDSEETENSGEDEYGLVDEDGDGVILVNVKGSTYVGYMLVVLDPTRVFVGMPNGYGGVGLTLDEMVEKYDALGGINGGIFKDDSGAGMGGDPQGLTIVDGVCYNSDNWATEATAGFDENGLLHVGNYTYEECVENGIIYAASFGPALISNGEITSSAYNSMSLNPRTAIAQRADGAVLMLVIDGRQVHSAGATYLDVAELLLSYGAVNACNLDGGSSTTMYFDGEYINSSSAGYGKRLLPTAFLIKK